MTSPTGARRLPWRHFQRGDEVAPDVFASVMATGIVSIAAAGHSWLLSRIFAALAVGITVLVVDVAVRRAVPIHDLRRPDVALRLFSFVAACTVLAARFEAHPTVTWTLGAVALTAWLALIPVAVCGLGRCTWTGLRRRAHGAWELASVATSGLAIVAAVLAIPRHLGGFLWLSCALWIAALVVYAVMTSLISWRPGAVQRPDRWAPDSWILMGGLAIATLAGQHVHRAALALGAHDWLLHGARALTVILWVAASVWFPVLLYAGVWRITRHQTHHHSAAAPRAWWATVFPLGMYSAATHALTVLTGWRALTAVSLVFFGIALTAWSLVAFATTRVMVRSLRAGHAPPPPSVGGYS